MRVAIFSEVLTPYISGISSHIEFLRKGLENLGHQVLVVTSSLYAEQPVFKRSKNIRGGTIRCPAKIANNKYGYECKNINDKQTIDFICSFKPDVIHIHTDTKIGYLGLLVADKLGCSVVFTIHDYYADRFAGDSSNISWKIKTYFEKKHFCDMIDNSNAVISSNRRAVNFIDETGRKKNVILIPEAADMKFFDYRKSNDNSVEKIRKKINIPQSATIAVFAGDLSIEKNLEFVLNAFSKRIKKENNIRLLIVGDGTETSYLKGLCRKMKISDIVVFLGAISHVRMPEIYSACDIYVCSSDDALMSVSFMEAMSCGLPVLVKEDKEKYVYNMIKDGINGFVYKNIDDFVNILKTTAQLSPYKKNKLKQLVRESLNNKDAIYMAKCVEKVYNQVIKINKNK